MAGAQQDLTVRGEQIERIFINYISNKYIVKERLINAFGFAEMAV